MTRLYLKLILLMGTAYLLSILMTVIIFGSLHQKYLRPNFAQEFEAVVAELGPMLAGMSAAEAQAEIDRQQLTFRARVVELDDDVEQLSFRPSGAAYRVVFEPDEDRFALFERQQGGVSVLALLMTTVVFAVTAFLITYPLVRRLKRQERTIGQIAEGDLSARVDERGKDALGLLGRRINLMADRIARLVDGQRCLLHAVSHEMRTPVARVGFGIEMIESAGSDDERRERIAALHDDLDEMNDLLDELLTFLRVDEAGGRLEKTPQDIAVTVQAVIAKTETLFPKVKIDNKLPPQVEILADARYLPRALENLIRNAARHASAVVQVSCRVDATVVILEIHDDGVGVPEPDRRRIFDAFTRLDGSRTRRAGAGDGAGLGLAICERIVRMHAGSIEVSDSPLGGAVFSVCLPRR